MRTIHLHPWLWATVTLSSILAMPAWSAAPGSAAKATQVAAKPVAPAPKVEAKKPAATVKPAAAVVVSAVKPVVAAKPAATAAKPVAVPAAKPAAIVAAKPATPAAKPVVKSDIKTDASGKPVAIAPKKNDSIKKRPFVVQGCGHKVNGTYIFGRAPYGCDASTYEDTDKVLTNMESLVFNEKKNQNEEVKRYSTAMFRFARDAADEYITRRSPNVSAKEKEAFRKGVMALMHQESFWSHYRISGKDGRMKIMKGDQDFSFGMMQIHGRWHKDMLMKFEGWTVKGNLAYGMDMYYQAWQKAKGLSCVKNFDQRARSAYSVYNAGSWAGCRWTNPDDKWARNDTGFYQKYTGQLWNKLIDKKQIAELPSDVQMACVFDTGGADCDAASDTRTL